MLLTKQQLLDLYALPLDEKIWRMECAINTHMEKFRRRAYVSVSGVDSLAVLIGVRRLFGNDVPAVFSDTGLEYPEVRSFWKQQDNVIWVHPRTSFQQVIEKCGYPVISKITARNIRDVQNASENNKATVHLRLTGIRRDGKKSKHGKIPNKWMFLVRAPFKISEQCCWHIKERPLIQFGKSAGLYPLTGLRADESQIREFGYMKTGCHAFTNIRIPRTNPISIWSKENVWEYLRSMNAPYPKIYDMGESRTGCMYCMFGIHLDGEPNRFQRMAVHHPKHYRYCMDKLGLRRVLRFMGIPAMPVENFTQLKMFEGAVRVEGE